MRESYNTPEGVHRRAKARGMDLVTITDPEIRDPGPSGSGPPYNRVVTEFDLAHRTAILSRDTSIDAERRQIEVWRCMSPAEKAEIVSQATSDVLTLAMSGIRQRHPGASERDCFLRLAELQLGPALVRVVYPDAAQVLGPHA